MEKNQISNNFSKTGVVWPLKISTAVNTANLEREYFEFQSTANKIFNKNISLKPHILSKNFFQLACDENVISNVKEIIGGNVYIWSSAFFAKAPSEGKIVSFHQDNPYWQLSTDKVITAWIALTNSNKESGCLEVVPNSSKLGMIGKLDVKDARESYLKGEKTTESKDLLSYKHDLSEFLKTNRPVDICLTPGQFSIHHVNTVHGSGINNTSNFRIGFAVRYISSDTYHLREKSDLATHVSGKKNNYYEEEKIPTGEFTKSSIDQYEKSMGSTGVFGNKKY